MTEFEQIRKELERLGWSVSRGRGDHFKFDKPGFHTITISVNINSKGRSYQNALANIRKQEPSFSVGKQECHLKKPKQQSPSLEQPALEKFEYIKRNQPIRYTSPEKKDFSKLSDPQSLMNVPYTVLDIKDKDGFSKDYVTSTGDMLLLTQGGTVLTVNVTDTDAWETFVCPRCGRVFPANLLDNESRMCSTCTVELQTIRKKCEKLASDKEFISKVGEVDKINLEDVIQLLPADFCEKHSSLMKTRFTKLPPEIMLEAAKHIAKNGKTRVKDTEPTKSKRSVDCSKPYGMWKEYLQNVLKVYEITHKNDANYVKVKSNLHSTKYVINTLNDSLKEFVLTAKDAETTYTHMKHSCFLYENLKLLMQSEDTDYALRICCPSAGFDMYIPSGTRILDDAVRALMQTSDGNTMNRFALVRNAETIPDYEEVFLNCNDIFNKYLDERQSRGMVNAASKTLCGIVFQNDTNGTLEDMANAEVQYRIHCLIEETEENVETAKDTAEFLSGIKSELLKKFKERFNTERIQLLVHIGKPNLKLLDSLFDPNMGEEYSAEPFRRTEPLLKTAMLQIETELNLIERFKEAVSERQDDRTEILSEIVNAGIRKYIGDNTEQNGPVETIPETSTTIPKPNESIIMTLSDNQTVNDSLAKTNPQSLFADFKEHTTLELLQELKARGVTFSEISVPVIVRQTISFDDL